MRYRSRRTPKRPLALTLLRFVFVDIQRQLLLILTLHLHNSCHCRECEHTRGVQKAHRFNEPRLSVQLHRPCFLSHTSNKNFFPNFRMTCRSYGQSEVPVRLRPGLALAPKNVDENTINFQFHTSAIRNPFLASFSSHHSTLLMF